MRRKTKLASISLLSVFALCAFSAPAASAKINEYKAIVNHLKTKYAAKKVEIPFLWLARFAVRAAHPAGVKSFSVTMFENLKAAPAAALDADMRAAMRNSMGAEWSSILRVRSQTDGSQIYMYMRPAGENNVKIMIVTIDRNQAAVVRAKISPDKLAEFVENPKIFGVSLGGDAAPQPAKKADEKSGS